MSNKKETKRIWSNEELTVAYYLTKYGIEELGITVKDLVDGVIGNTTVHSLNMQMANFRFALNLDGYQLEDVSQAMWKLVENYKNITKLLLKTRVMTYIDTASEKIQTAKIKRNNKKGNERKDELNRIERENFQKRLKVMGMMGRKLRPVVN